MAQAEKNNPEDNKCHRKNSGQTVNTKGNADPHTKKTMETSHSLRRRYFTPTKLILPKRDCNARLFFNFNFSDNICDICLSLCFVRNFGCYIYFASLMVSSSHPGVGCGVTTDWSTNTLIPETLIFSRTLSVSN